MPSNAQEFLGAGYANALKVFYGSVTEAFRDRVYLFDVSSTDNTDTQPIPKFVSQKTIDYGASAQFEMMSDLPDAEEHTPGDELQGQQFEVKPGTITIDDKPVVAHVDVAETHLRLAHYEPLQRLGRKLGYSLARAYDKRLFQLAALGARVGAVFQNGLNIHNGGSRVERVAATLAGAYPVTPTGARNFRDDTDALAERQDSYDVPETGRYLFIDPYIRRVLLQDPGIFDINYTRDNPNSLNGRVIGMISGYDVIVANKRIPNTKITAGPAKYRGDFTIAGSSGQPAALALCGASEEQAGIGTLVAQGIVPDMERQIKTGTVFMKASIFMGADIQHPWCLGSIEVDDS